MYLALENVKRRIPVRILRFCREQLYSLVKGAEPEQRLRVVNYDELDDRSDVDFVVGIGVAAENVSDRGYVGVESSDLFKELLGLSCDLDAARVLNESLPALLKKNGGRCYLPVFCFAQKTSLSKADLQSLPAVSDLINRDHAKFRSAMYGKQFAREAAHLSTKQIVEDFSSEKAAAFIPWQSSDSIDLEEVRSFLCDHLDNLFQGDAYSTYFRKLACLYDYLKHPLQ